MSRMTEIPTPAQTPDDPEAHAYEQTEVDTSGFAFRFTDDYGGVYEPWTDGHRVGFRVTRDGQTQFLTISPSIGSDQVGDDTTCAFIRLGETPDNDDAHTHFILYGSEG